jgi:hypothetical protein
LLPFLLSFTYAVEFEFLTHETTCASEMLEKTTYENFCQKRPPAAWASAGRPLPPSPCRHWHWRQVRPRRHAAIGIGGKCGHVTMPPLALAASASKIFILFTCFVTCFVGRLVPRHLAGNEDGGRAHTPNGATCQQRQRRQGPAGTGPGGTCHVSPGPGVPPLIGGLF